MRYLGMAVSGHPYMGCKDYIMAYRKTLCYKQRRDLPPHSESRQRGEDDLFINGNSPMHAIHRVGSQPLKARDANSPRLSIKEYGVKEKISWRGYQPVISWNRPLSLLDWGLAADSWFYTAIIATITIQYSSHQWTIAGICRCYGQHASRCN